MTTYLSVEDLLQGDDAQESRRAFAAWRSALRDVDAGAIVDLEAVPGGKGLRLALREDFDRLLSAFVCAAVLDAAPGAQVALGSATEDFHRLTQFTKIGPTRELLVVAAGPDAQHALEVVIDAAARFNRAAFDSDGFVK